MQMERGAGDGRRTLVLKLAAAAGVALLTANCGSSQTAGRSIDPKYGVAASPRLFTEGQSIPKGGGREMVGKPYQVAGRTFVPREDRDYSRVGLASWYGAAFHGRMTANGEVFDRKSFVAAHPTMPLPSYARVTNTENGASMIVRVNDRGPFHANRIIDVSENVAEALDFKRAGTARVRVDYIGRASTNGSDDEKLYATLRDDGLPAELGRTGNVVAQATAPRQAPYVVASAAVMPSSARAYAPPAQQQAALAESQEVDEEIVEEVADAAPAVLPPQRPASAERGPAAPARTTVLQREAPMRLIGHAPAPPPRPDRVVALRTNLH